MSNYSDWDQCEACGKMALLSDLNEEGLCPTCSAEWEGQPMSNDGRKDTDRLAASASNPHQYGDNERDEAYEAHLDAMARCPECHEGYMREGISVAGEPETRICPECGYWEYTDRD